MEKENRWHEFGRLLQRYRLREGLSQKGLWKELTAEGIELYDKSSISRWEAGRHRPSVETVETLEKVLNITRGRLLRAADYLIEDTEPVQQDRPISRLRQAKIDHLNRLVEIAGDLLAGGGWELERVVRILDDNSVDTESLYKITFPTQYEISSDQRRRGVTGGALTRILMSNWHSVCDQSGVSQAKSLLCHVMAELPPKLVEELPSLQPGRPQFEYLAVTRPYVLIYILRGLCKTKEFKGTCEICKDLNRRYGVDSTELPDIDEQTISGLDSR